MRLLAAVNSPRYGPRSPAPSLTGAPSGPRSRSRRLGCIIQAASLAEMDCSGLLCSEARLHLGSRLQGFPLLVWGGGVFTYGVVLCQAVHLTQALGVYSTCWSRASQADLLRRYTASLGTALLHPVFAQMKAAPCSM